jgi:3-oxoacyl-(acyl-carrier-protein) synthase
MAVFIKGMASISPQQSWGDKSLMSLASEYSGNSLSCIEPDYSVWLDPRQSRRMSRIIKMGVTCSIMALRDAGFEKPDMIVTGTGYGCLEDTGAFLTKMISQDEQALNPTPFIQSTHNSIGAQIALLLQCHDYNQTYSQGAFSFEHALLDSMLLLGESDEKTILLGGLDETTAASHAIHERFGIYRKKAVRNLDLFRIQGTGTIAGEGASFFVLSANGNAPVIATIERVATFYKPSLSSLKMGVEEFLAACSLTVNDIDLLLSGKNGDSNCDKNTAVIENMFLSGSLAAYKHLCGEFPVASSFALWLAARMIHQNYIPEIVKCRDTGRKLMNVLIYNPYFSTHHSLILLKA